MGHVVLTIAHRFSARRALRDFAGVCAGEHDADFRVELAIKTQLVARGYALDFYAVKEELNTLLAQIENTLLNEHPPFDIRNPTTENISHWVAEQMQARLQDQPGELQSVKVSENEDFSATYLC